MPNSLVIPEAALFEDAGSGTNYVFVRDAAGRARRTTVTVGIRSNNRVQILAGLEQGEMVATSGGYALSDGLKVKFTETRN